MIRELKVSFLFVLLSAQIGMANKPELDTKERIVVSRSVGKIGDGTLWSVQKMESQKRSGWTRHTASIGFRIKKDKTLTVEPVISLPQLENDRYEFTIEDKFLVVRLRDQGQVYLKLTLSTLKRPEQ